MKTVTIYEYLFKFMYYDTIAIRTADFLPVLAIACKYQVAALIKECSDITPELSDLTGTSQLLEKVLENYSKEMEPLVDKCNAMLCEQFSTIYKKEDFCSMSKDLLKGILERDDVAAEEKEIFDALKKWINHKPEREKYLEELLSLIRFPTMDAKAVSQLESDPFFKKTPILAELQMEALKYLADPKKIPEEERTTQKKYQYR